MFQDLFRFAPFMKLGFSFADGTATGGASGEQGDKAGEPAKNEDASIKADIERIKQENDKLKQELEDTRLEVMTPDYLDYLNSREKGNKQPEPVKAQADIDFDKLSKKEVYERAKEDAKRELKSEIDGLKEEFTSKSKADVQREVAAFSRSHEDFEKYRPLMYGLSLDPKNKDLTLPELYDKAKEHVKRIHVGPTDQEKEKSRKSSGEKPGYSTPSFERNKKYTPQDAAEEAWNETFGDS